MIRNLWTAAVMIFVLGASEAAAIERSLEVPASTPGLKREARLNLPDTGFPSHGVLLIPVAGPTDVDMRLGPRGIFSTIAQELAEMGIASLRIADRGVGGSGGDWLETDLEMRIADAATALAWFRDLPELRGSKIGALGISEGGAISCVLGGSPGGPDFVVALSTPMEDGMTTLRGQRDRLLGTAALPPDQVAGLVAESDRFLTALADGDENEIRSVLGGPYGTLLLPPYYFVPRDEAGRLHFALSPWYRSQVTYEIEDRVRRISVPVFAAYGSLDQVIDVKRSAALLDKNLELAPTGVFRVATFEKLNHLMMPAVTGSPMEYAQLPDIVSQTLWEEVGLWIRER